MIEVKELYKKFGKVEVLKGVSLKVDKPEIVAILGPNGSGKTTLIKSILGMVIPDKGQILLDGQSVSKKWKYRNDLDYLPQIAQFPPNLKVRELISMIRRLRPKKADPDSLITEFSLEKFLDQKLGNLSGGTRQKVNIVLALMFDCPVMILDEPTTGLDPVSLITLKGLIRKAREKGKIILITSHIMSFVEEMADEVIFLLEGRIYFRDTVKGLLERTGMQDLERAIASILKEHHAEDSGV